MIPAEKTLDYYKRLSYTLRAEPIKDSDGSNYWIAEYLELRGCKTDGTTEAEAIANLYELFDEYVLTKMENKAEIPEPVHVQVTVKPWKLVQKKRTPPALPHPDVDTEETKGETKYKEVEVPAYG